MNLTAAAGGTVNLYAKWTANSYTVTFVGGANSTVSPAAKQVTYDEEYGTLPTPVRDGYVFDTWYKESAFTTKITADTKYTTANNSSLYARWEQVSVIAEDKAVYANGNAITIIAGTGNTTTIKAGGTTYAADIDMSDWTIYGGAKNDTVASTSITMTGGNVDRIVGSGKVGTVTGGTTVTVTGGTTGEVRAKTVNVSGNPTIGNQSTEGIDLSATTAKYVNIIGTLTGSSGEITLLKPSSTEDDTIVAAAGDVAWADVTKFTLSGQTLMSVDKNIIIFTEKLPKLYSMGYNSDEAIILETATRTFYKKLAANLYGSAYGGYYKLNDQWAPILLSSREEAVQWIGVNEDGSSVNNPMANTGAHNITFAGQTYYYSTDENIISSTNSVTGPEEKVYLGIRKTPEAAARYILSTLPQYVVSYDENGGTLASGETLPIGHKKLKGLPYSIPMLSLTKEMDGRQIAISGWNTAADGSGTAYDLGGSMITDENGNQIPSVRSFYSLDSSVTLYAQYATNKVEVELEHGSITGTRSVLATKGQMMPSIPMLPIKQTSATFAGYYDADGTQYYNEKGVPVRVYPTENGPTKLTARWASGEGIFAGRYSQYQVFDCKRTPAYPTVNQPFRVSGFANPFTDSGQIKRSGKGYNGQMNDAEISGKIFYFKPSGNASNPFILWFADSVADADAGKGKQVSKAGKIYALGTEGFLFTSATGNDYGYFISMSQAFNKGDEITYLPTNPGPITEGEANEIPANPNPWDPNESYAVTFDSNGATVVAAPSKISVRKPEDGGAVTLENLPSSPSRTGYTFDGWYTAAGGGTEFDAYATPITKNITVYAHWAKIINNTTTSISLYKDKLVWANQTIQVQPVDADNNLTGTPVSAPYVGRSKTYVTDSGAVSTSGSYAVLKDGQDMGVRFTHTAGERDDVEVSFYTVGYKPNGGTDSVPQGAVVLEGSTYNVLFTPQPDKTGYTFKGWTDRPAGQQAAQNDGFRMYEPSGAGQSFEVVDTTYLIAVYKQPTPTIGGIGDDFTLTQPDTVNGKGSITLNPNHGDPGDFEYSVDGGNTWKPWPDNKTLEPEQGQTVQIRRPNRGSDLMSDAADAAIDSISSLKDLVIPEDYTGTYDGKPHGITIDKTGGAWDATVTYYTDDTYETTTTEPQITNVADSPRTVYYSVSKPLYETVKGSKKITINKAPITVTYPGDSVVYTGSVPALSPLTYSGFVNGETDSVLTTKPAVTNTDTTPGIYPLTPVGGMDDNYSFTYVGGTLTISKANMTASDVTASGYTGEYDGAEHGITVTLAGLAAGGTITYRTSETGDYGLSVNPSYKDAGTYTVYYKVTKTGYNDVTGQAQVVISKKTLTVDTVSVDGKEYDGTTTTTGGSITLIGRVTGETVTAGGTITFGNKNVGDDKAVNIADITLGGVDAGNYVLSDTALNNVPTTAAITAKEVTLNWTGADKIYDGQPLAVGATVAGATAGDVCNVTVTVTVTGDSVTAPNAGSYTATASLTNVNYKLQGATTKSYQINKAMLMATYEGATLIYKDTVPEEAKRVSVTGFVNGETGSSAAGYVAPTVTIPSKGADEVYIETLTPSGGQADNYSFAYVAGTFNVINRSFDAVLVQDYLEEYDGAPHGLTIVNTDQTSSNAVIRYYNTKVDADSDTLGTGGTDVATTATNAGTTTVYFKVFATGYDSATGTGTITIQKKQVTPTLTGSGTKIYDGTTAAPTGITLGLEGLVGSEDAGLTGMLSMSDSSVGTGKDVSASGITITNSNYELTGTTASLTGAAEVTPKEITLTWSGYNNLTYTGQEQNVTAVIPAGTLVSGDTCTVSVNGGNAKNYSVTEYTANAVLSNENYTITNQTKDYSIQKAALTAAFHDETITYGNLPVLEISVTGFVGGERATSAAGYIAPTIQTAIPTAAGIHTLTLTGGSADNYSFTLETGTLTISPADMSGEVTASGYTGVYDETGHVISVAAPAGATVTYYSDPARQTGITNAFSDVSDSKTVYYKVTKPNYQDVTGDVAVVITPKAITPSVEVTGTKTYDGGTALGAAAGSITLSGVVNGDTVTGSAAITFTTPGAGKHKQVSASAITLLGIDKGNYQLTAETIASKTTAAEITPKELTLTWNDGNLVYSGTAKNVTASLNSDDLVMQGGTKDICTVTVRGGRQIKTGDYTATAELSNPDYGITTASKTHAYTIAKAELIAKFKSERIDYGSNPALEIEVTGFVSGEDATKADGYHAPVIGTNPIPVDFGIHPITIDVSAAKADNYFFTADNTGELSITKALMDRLVSAQDYTGIYDKQPHGITVTAPPNTTITYYLSKSDAEAGTNELIGGNEKQTNAGTYTIWFKAVNQNYEDVIGSAEIKINKKKLTPSVTASGTKVYDGSTALGTATAAVALEGIVTGDIVSVDGNESIVFVTSDAEAGKKVTVTGITLSGDDKDNYELSSDTLSQVATDAEITQKEITLSWSKDTGLVYDGNAKDVTAGALGVETGDTCIVTVTGGRETLPGSYLAQATGLSNLNYKLPAETTHDYTIAKGTITGVTATPTDKLYDETWSDGVNVTGTKPGDKIWYSTDGGNTWTETIPQVGPVGTTDILVKVEREHYDDLILGPVTAQVTSGPKVSIGKPGFTVGDVKQVTVTGTVKAGNYPVASQTFEIRKTDTDSWTPLHTGITANGITTYSQLLAELEEGSEYELRLTATDAQGNRASDTLKFRTQPKTPPTGAIEGTVTGTGSITVTIEMGNTVVATLAGLSTGDRFSFQNLPDGEYNLVATDSDYKITKMVTVKDGKTTELGVIAIGVKQSAVKVNGSAPAVAVNGLNELFDTSTFTEVSEAVAAVTNGGTVEIRLTANDAKNQNEIDEITQSIDTQTIGVMLDLTVDMLIMPDSGLTTVKNLKEVDSLLTIAVPLPKDATGKTKYRAYRHHAGVEELTLLKGDDTATEGTFRVDGNYVYIYSSKFSTYAITYAKGGGGNGSGGSDGSYHYYTIALKAGSGGRFHPDKASVRVREGDSAGFDIIPDEGYDIVDVKVDGTSVGAVSSYLFYDVRANHTVTAHFEKLPVVPELPTESGTPPSLTPEIPGEGGNSGITAPSLPQPAVPGESGKRGGTPSPETGNGNQSNSDLDASKEGILRDLKAKYEEAIAGLPDTLTKEQRQQAIDELTRIYEEAARAIGEAGSTSIISEIYNQAVRDFEAVSAGLGTDSEEGDGENSGTELPSAAQAGQPTPFILASALLALVSILDAMMAWRRKKDEENEDGDSSEEEQKHDRKHIWATGLSIIATLVFLLTTGWHGIALANWWTLAVALPTVATIIMTEKTS